MGSFTNKTIQVVMAMAEGVFQNGANQITVADFTNLQCGDIIRLDTRTDSELEVFVGNIKKFTALPGTNNDKYAVRVTSVIREEE